MFEIKIQNNRYYYKWLSMLTIAVFMQYRITVYDVKYNNINMLKGLSAACIGVIHSVPL